MNLRELVADYHPTKQAIQLVDDTKVVLLVGISGAGKDTIKNLLLRDSMFRDIVSHTTRAPRSNNGIPEVDGKDYHFIDQERAVEMLEAQEFIEVKLVHGTIYGTSTQELATAYSEGLVAITDIDVQGVSDYKSITPDVVAIFMLPPDYETWKYRLQSRYDTKEEFEAEWPRRRTSAIEELEHALEVPYYHFIINDDLAESVHTTRQISLKPDIYNRKDDEARIAARDLLDEIIVKAAEEGLSS